MKKGNDNRTFRKSVPKRSGRNFSDRNGRNDRKKDYGQGGGSEKKEYSQRGYSRNDDERSFEKKLPYERSGFSDRGYRKADMNSDKPGSRKPYGKSSYGKPGGRSVKKDYSQRNESGEAGEKTQENREYKKIPIGKIVKKEWERKEHSKSSGYGRPGVRRGEFRSGDRPYREHEEKPAEDKLPQEHQHDYIMGRKPVLEALRANARIEKIYFKFGLQGEILKDIRTEAKKNKVEVVELPESKFSRYGSESNTQGVVALRGMVKFYELEELIDAARNGNKTLLILENIQDPQNLGAIIRSAECFGTDGVIITIKNSAPINETVSKVSAGALEYIKLHKSANLGITIEKLKENGFWIVGTTLSDSATGISADKETLVAVIMGNEEKGVRQSIIKECDMTYKIPLKGRLQSLNVSVATGVTLFEINRLRTQNIKTY